MAVRPNDLLILPVGLTAFFAVIGSRLSVLIALFGLVLIAIGWKLPDEANDIDRRSSNWDPDDWFDRLEGLLRGRYSYPRRIARD